MPNNENFVASLFIKIENENDKEEKYYHSITFDFDSNEEKNNTYLIIIILCCIILIIIILLIFLLCYRKMKNKNKVLKEEVEAITFSTGIDEDTLNNRNNKKINEDYETTFI